MSAAVQFIPPGRAKRLVAWIAPGGAWGICLMFCPWMFHFGLEVWRHGCCLNVGPLSLGIAALESAPTPEPEE